jgi:hypothetical protein
MAKHHNKVCLTQAAKLESNHQNGNTLLWRFVQNKLFFKLVTALGSPDGIL